MGKGEKISRKLDTWLGRGFKASKLKSLLGLTVSRLAVLRNQRRARCDHARSDVAELLRQGHQERALLRAEYVTKEQNMMDAFAMVESYCHVVMERATLLENQKGCPDELREAIAGLLFAESRCGELPELHEVRSIFASRLGKEFVAAAVELRNNCGVNTKIIQKMSTKQASLENRVKVTKDIAAEVGIALHLEEPSSELEMQPTTPKQPAAGADDVSGFAGAEYSSESMKMRQRYKDAASAAQAAFESAAYAAAAARAAVELSRSESQGKGSPGDKTSPSAPARTASADRSHPFQTSSSESESDQGVKQGSEPVLHPGEGKHASLAGSKHDNPLPARGKRIAYETSEEEEESEDEGGGGEFMGNPPGPMHRRAPESGERFGHGFQWRRQFGVSSDEDTSDEEVEEVRPQMATFRSPARPQGIWERSQHQEPYKAEYTYRKEEEQEEGEESPAARLRERSRVRNAAMDAAVGVPVHKLGMRTGPVSMRTRRSGF